MYTPTRPLPALARKIIVVTTTSTIALFGLTALPASAADSFAERDHLTTPEVAAEALEKQRTLANMPTVQSSGAVTTATDSALSAPDRHVVGIPQAFDGVTDPLYDVYDGRSDITTAGVDARANGIVAVGLFVDIYANPFIDYGWTTGPTGPNWVFDTNLDGTADYEVAVFNINDNLVGAVWDTHTGTIVCDVQPNTDPAYRSYGATFDVACIGNPEQFGWFARMNYDGFVYGFEYDEAPNFGWAGPIGNDAYMPPPAPTPPTTVPPAPTPPTTVPPATKPPTTVPPTTVPPTATPDPKLGVIASRERRCFTINGEPGDVAIVNLTPVLASGPGNGQLVSSDVALPPTASNVNFGTGTVDPNVAVAPIGRDGQVCFVNSQHASLHLIADHLGTIDADSYTAASSSGAPERRVDTRIDRGAGRLASSARVCFVVSGRPGDAALINLTPFQASGPGNGQLVSSDVRTPPTASNVNFGPGTVDPNVAVAPIGRDGRVCFINSEHSSVDLVADHLGTIDADAYTPAAASGAPDRRIDTRTGLGGTLLAPSRRACMSVTGKPGDAAVVNLTPVLAAGHGNGQLVSSNVGLPPTASNVNFAPGTIDPNVAIAPIGSDGRVCFVNSNHTSVHLVADHLGTIGASAYTPAIKSGAPDRRIDTRRG